MRSDNLGTFDQPRPEYRMCQIGLRLGKIADRVRLGRRTAPEPSNLRKDEPHPVTGLAPVPQLGDGVLISTTAVLGCDESLEVHV